MPLTPDAVLNAGVDDARELAARICARASLRVVPVESPAEAERAVEALNSVWGTGPSSMPSHLVRALAHTGNYVVGMYDAEDEDLLLGASIAFFADPSSRVLHSHITGILPGHRGRRLGTAVKLHQRAWALERGLAAISWTYDPLVSRNAHFNLVSLGARAGSYHRNFYGAVGDRINHDEPTDRIHVHWSIADDWNPSARPPDVEAGAVVLLETGSGLEPIRHDLDPGAEAVLVGIPHDVEALRLASPELSARWRKSVQGAFDSLLDTGYTIQGFTANDQYLLRRTP